MIGSGSQADVYTCNVVNSLDLVKDDRIYVTKTKKIVDNLSIATHVCAEMNKEFKIA